MVKVEENRIEKGKGGGGREEERRGIEGSVSNSTSSPLEQRNIVLLSSNFIIAPSGYNTRACAVSLLLAYALRK